MERRMFLAALAAIAVDPERALWVPGRRMISFPNAFVNIIEYTNLVVHREYTPLNALSFRGKDNLYKAAYNNADFYLMPKRPGDRDRRLREMASFMQIPLRFMKITINNQPIDNLMKTWG